MAISVDTVYKTVLFILNKEQRGYITPAEFNKLAEQAQLEIFERYFEDLNQALRMPENDSEYANRVKTLEEKIQEMEINADYRIQKFNEWTKRYSDMYLLDNQMQLDVCLEDPEYTKWLDPDPEVGAYRKWT